MMPMIMAGDDKQFQPAVQGLEGHLVKRLAGDGRMSPFLWTKIQGFPVFRLRIQWRTAVGMFELSHMLAYPDTGLQYGSECNIEHEKHRAGHALEYWLHREYPNLTPPPDGKLYPAFVDCKGTTTTVDIATMSKANTGQCERALDFHVRLVQNCNVDPQDLAFISPYQSNVELINRLLAKPEVSITFYYQYCKVY